MTDRSGQPPWFDFDVAAWKVIAGVLEESGKPWPREAMLMDLRWWQDQEYATDGKVSRPGRPALRRRWSVTDYTVRKMLRAEKEWSNPKKVRSPGNRQRTDRTPTADRQRTDSGPTAAERSNADNQRETDSGPTADRQRTDRTPTADRHTRVVDQNTEPEHRAQKKDSPKPPLAGGEEGASATAPPVGMLPDLAVRLNGRTASALERAGLTTPEAIAALTPSELRSRPGIGRKSVGEVMQALAEMGLSLRKEPERPPSQRQRHPQTRLVTDLWSEVHLEITRRKYRGWNFNGRPPNDNDHARDWIDAAGVQVDAEAGLQRLRGAIRAYVEAAESGEAYPHGDPPTTRWFTKDIAKWLGVAERGGARPKPEPRGRDRPSGGDDYLTRLRRNRERRHQQAGAQIITLET